MPTGTSTSGLRRYHRHLVLTGIDAQPGISRVELADRTGLSGMAISRIVRELIESELVEETGKLDRDGVPGRRQTGLQVAADGAHVLGLVISAFGHHLVLANSRREILHAQRLHFYDITDSASVIDDIVRAVGQMLEKNGGDRNRVLGMGVAIAGIVDQDNRTVLGAPYLSWDLVDLGGSLQDLCAMPVTVENIATALGLAECSRPEMGGRANMLFLRPAITIGGAILDGGIVIRGTNANAGQIGHLIDQPTEFTCVCGRNDCLNTTASGWAILARLGKVSSKVIRAEEIEACSDLLTELITEDPDVNSDKGEVLLAAGQALARNVQNIWITLNPNVVMMAGPLAESRAYLEGFNSVWRGGMQGDSATEPAFQIARFSPSEAAVHLAINATLLSPDLAFENLSGSQSDLRGAAG